MQYATQAEPTGRVLTTVDWGGLDMSKTWLTEPFM